MQQAELNWIVNFIWGIADDVLRDLYVLCASKKRETVEVLELEPTVSISPNT